MSDAPPEPDRLPGAPHPRDTARLFGQAPAEAELAAALAGGRLHHAWLLAGPRGTGKATLAWRLARALLAEAPAEAGQGAGLFGDEPAPPAPTLDVPPDHPVSRRLAALSEPRFFLLRRPYDDKTARLRQEITVDEVRRLKSFFTLSAAEGGRRVALVDAADELNTAAANALLKLLEEPPAGATLILVAHQPARLLPTIRSRCRTLRLSPLSPGDMAAALAQAGVEAAAEAEAPQALAELAGGSVGAAIELSAADGLELYAEIVGLFAGSALDRPRAVRLADGMSGRQNDARFALFLRLVDTFLARLARFGAGMPPAAEAAPGEAAVLAALCPGESAARAWAALHQDAGARARHGRAVNLDPSTLCLDMVLTIAETAARLRR